MTTVAEAILASSAAPDGATVAEHLAALGSGSGSGPGETVYLPAYKLTAKTAGATSAGAIRSGVVRAATVTSHTAAAVTITNEAQP